VVWWLCGLHRFLWASHLGTRMDYPQAD